MFLKQLCCIGFLFLFAGGVHSQNNDPNILVFSKTNGWRHESIPTGIKFMLALSKANNWKVDFSEDSTDFNDENLKLYDAVVFLNTTGDILGKNGQMAFRKYIENAGSFVGIHAASDTEKEWPWFTEMIGATFKSHPKVQNATLHIDKTSEHPAINHLKSTEIFKDEWYNFLKPVAQHVNVLASLDERSYEGERMNTESHPITWYHHYDGGRVFYTGLGHTIENYSDIRFEKLVKGGIEWALGTVDSKAPAADKWTNLFEGEINKTWDVFIGAPHATKRTWTM